MTDAEPDALVSALRAAGCVFAEDEAALLHAATHDDAELAAMLARRVGGEPLEHIVGWVELAGMRIHVGPGAFVPRQRTALLIEQTVAAVHSRGRARMLEVYAGVTPVAAAVAALPGAAVEAIEVDPIAAGFAERNLPATATVHLGQVFDALPDSRRGAFDVIAGVPPYVPLGTAALLPHESREHEPATALFGGDDGLDAVRTVVTGARAWLAPAGVVLLELGARQADAAIAVARAGGWSRASILAGDDGQTALLVLHA